MILPNIWKNYKNGPNHQPETILRKLNKMMEVQWTTSDISPALPAMLWAQA